MSPRSLLTGKELRARRPLRVYTAQSPVLTEEVFLHHSPQRPSMRQNLKYRLFQNTSSGMKRSLPERASPRPPEQLLCGELSCHHLHTVRAVVHPFLHSENNSGVSGSRAGDWGGQRRTGRHAQPPVFQWRRQEG